MARGGIPEAGYEAKLDRQRRQVQLNEADATLDVILSASGTAD